MAELCRLTFERASLTERTTSPPWGGACIASTKGAPVKWLIGIFAAIAAAAVAVFLGRKNPAGVWTQVTEATSSFGKNPADKSAHKSAHKSGHKSADKSAHKSASAATSAADETKGAAPQ